MHEIAHDPDSTADAEKAHQHALKLIYRHTHRDFKGTAGDAKCIMIARGNVALDELTEAEVADLLPRALKKEALRLAIKAGGVKS